MPPEDLGARVGLTRAIAPVVRLLCEVRLVVLLLAVVSASTSWWLVAVAVVAAPCSYLPARFWVRQGGRIAASGIYLGLDSAVAIAVVVVFGGSEAALVYGGATVTLVGIVASRAVALICAALLGSTMVLVASVGPAGAAAGLPVVVAAGLGCGVLALAGGALGTALRAQAVAVELLAAERATRTADLERVSVARDVHDSVAGSLAGLVLMTDALERKVQASGVDAATLTLAQQVREASKIAHVDTRAVLDQLRQLDPDPVAALEQVCRRWSIVGGVAAVFNVEGDAPLDGGLSSTLKAMLTELLENVRKHAQASRVDVRLVLASDCVRLTVVDDGRGFETGAPGPAEGHYGLLGLRERAQEAAGTVEIASRPGRTAIDIELRVRADKRVES